MKSDWSRSIARELELLEEEIHARTRSSDPELDEVVDHVLFPGGKRIRPAVVILSYLASGGNDVESITPLAAAIELIHTGTLVHDDINDNSTMRRGKSSAHIKYGIQKAIVAGDYLFVKAYEIGSEYPPIIMKLTAEICSRLAEGEFAQNRELRNLMTDEQKYLEIVEKKTALPLSLSARVGALMASDGENEPLATYGFNIGMAFQISDDILDITGDPRSTRKSVGVDIRQGAPNILVIRALRTSNEGERLASLLRSPEGNLDDIVKMILRTDALDYARSKTGMYCERALRAIAPFKGNVYMDSLGELAEFVCRREC